MLVRVESGIPIGILGYRDGEPVAWCSIAPRDTYRRLSPLTNSPADTLPESVWAIACFFVLRRLRGQGLTRMLIRAALEYAHDNGAAVVEAYPVDPESPSYRFMGLVATFEAMGFSDVGMAGSRRHVMQLRL